jgi:outer membrane protein TolC
MAQENVIQIDAQRWQRLAPLLPQVDLAASFTINQQEVELDMSGGVDPADIPAPFQDLFAGFAGDPIIVQPKTAWTGRLSIYQTLLNGQALPGLQGLARLGRAARSEVEAARDQLRAGVARSYYGLVVARESAVLAGRQLETARHLLDLAQRQVAAGLADRRAVLQGELSIARAERGVAAATEQVVSAEQRFMQLTGLPSDTPVEMPTPTQPPGDVEAALQAAWEHRPDLQGASERVEAARRFRLASDLGWAPTVGIGFRELYSQVPGFVPENFQWQVGLDISWNLWDGGYRISRSRELASQVRVADLAVEQIREGAEAEIRTLFQTYERAETALRGVEAEIRLAEEGLRLAETAVVAGRGTWLEVEQARLALEAARMGLLTERMDRDIAAIDLAAATGLL